MLSAVRLMVLIFGLLAALPPQASAAAEERIPSFGEGPQEVLVFSDYFCPPCRELEPRLEPVLDALYRQGRVKIRFVDTPMHRETPLFAKFYLYAAKATPDYGAAVRARRVLFALAGRENVFWMDERIEEAFRKENIAYRPFDFRTVQPEFNRLIREHRVNSTPSCVVVSPGEKPLKYVGADDILKGLQSLSTGPAAR